MTRRTIEFSLENRFLVLLMATLIAVGGIYAVTRIPLDAIPDLSDVQVIVFTEYPGQAPRIIEDQVTYPIATRMLSVPYAKVVRGYSFFNFSFVYVLFEDGTDLYWARTRVLEYLSQIRGQLPPAVNPALGPDATALGQIFWYTLEGRDPQGRAVGGWDPEQDCGFESDEIITDGGGVVFIRNTGVEEAKYKWFTVREIAASIE